MEFTYKKSSEIKAMSDEELDAYLTAKGEHEKALITKAIEEQIEKTSKEDKERIDLLQKTLETAVSEIDTLIIESKKRSEIPSNGEDKNSLKAQLEANKEKLKAMKYSNKFDNVVIKVAGNMSIGGNTTGQIPQAERIAGLNDIAKRRVRLLDIMTKGSISSNLVEWVYKANQDGTAGQTAEGILKNQIDFDLIVASQKVEKTTAFITVTDEMLDDVDYIQSAINTELQTELLKAVEVGAYSGDGITPNLNGIRTVAPSFSAGTLALTVDNANEVDVLAVAMNQIMLAHQDEPTHILMHPTDVTKLKMYKVSSSDRRYVERVAQVGSTLSVDGVPIIPTTLVTAGQYLIGDFTKANLWTRSGIQIEIGYNADNFVKNFKTIRAEWRGVVFVKNNDRTAFVKGVFATDKTALETT
jgi:HK97 family phage major capsid protein